MVNFAIFIAGVQKRATILSKILIERNVQWVRLGPPAFPLRLYIAHMPVLSLYENDAIMDLYGRLKILKMQRINYVGHETCFFYFEPGSFYLVYLFCGTYLFSTIWSARVIFWPPEEASSHICMSRENKGVVLYWIRLNCSTFTLFWSSKCTGSYWLSVTAYFLPPLLVFHKSFVCLESTLWWKAPTPRSR